MKNDFLQDKNTLIGEGYKIYHKVPQKNKDEFIKSIPNDYDEFVTFILEYYRKKNIMPPPFLTRTLETDIEYYTNIKYFMLGIKGLKIEQDINNIIRNREYIKASEVALIFGISITTLYSNSTKLKLHHTKINQRRVGYNSKEVVKMYNEYKKLGITFNAYCTHRSRNGKSNDTN